MQVVLIGRDGTNDTLKISTNGKSVNGPKVTKTMSREHCKLTINDDGTATIENINPRNVTFVNGQPVMSKVISGTDVVELGGDRYKLDLAPFKLAKFADIRHLEILIPHTYARVVSAGSQIKHRRRIVAYRTDMTGSYGDTFYGNCLLSPVNSFMETDKWDVGVKAVAAIEPAIRIREREELKGDINGILRDISPAGESERGTDGST